MKHFIPALIIPLASITYGAENLVEPFQGASIDPALNVPAGYAFGSASSPSGVLQRVHLGDRAYIRTVGTDYASRDFTFYLTSHIHPIETENASEYWDALGLTFMGIGSGIGDQQFFTEPHTAAYMRTWPGSDMIISHAASSSTGRSERSFGPLASEDVIRMRIQKAGNTITFAYDVGYTGGQFVADYQISRSFSSTYPFLDDSNSHLFFGCDVPARIDDVAIVTEGADFDGQALRVSLPEYEYVPAFGSVALEGLTITANSTPAFIFATENTGSWCIISCSDDMAEWHSFTSFVPDTEGTRITDAAPIADSRFYRSSYLPAGVEPADHFDYPIASGMVDEQIDPERNDFYLSSSAAEPFERGATSPDTASWYNYQDVGSYYATFGGLHGGEDWNKGSGTADVGEQTKAIANGQIIDIRSAHSAGASHSGYAVLVRHWLLNGTSIDSLYVHLAPDESGGLPNTGGVIGPESEFSLQEGAPVSRGDVIGVVGAVTSPAMTPHLHFEMRSTQTNPSDLWPNDTGDGYYGPVPGPDGNRSPSITPEEVQAAFSLMQKDGIIDPSDFIDDHR